MRVPSWSYTLFVIMLSCSFKADGTLADSSLIAADILICSDLHTASRSRGKRSACEMKTRTSSLSRCTDPTFSILIPTRWLWVSFDTEYRSGAGVSLRRCVSHCVEVTSMCQAWDKHCFPNLKQNVQLYFHVFVLGVTERKLFLCFIFLN